MTVERTALDVPQVAYGDLRPKLRTGDLLLCSGAGAISSMIQIATRSIWSHVAVIVPIEAIDRVMVLESKEGHGCRSVALSSYLADYEGSNLRYPGELVIARHRGAADALAPAGRVATFTKTAIDMLGWPYSLQDILRISMHIAGTGKLLGEAARARALICSEYAARCFSAVGITLQDQDGYITPADIAADPAVELLARLR